MLKRFFCLLIMISIFSLLTACGNVPAKEPEKILKVGIEPTFAPFEFYDEKTKDYAGFDIDIIRAIAKEIGYQVKFEKMHFDELLHALDVGKIDVAASAITITEERRQKALFSQPYYAAGLTIVVLSNNNDINGIEDLINKKIAVQEGTTSALQAKTIKNARVKELKTFNEIYSVLKDGTVDAVLNDKPVNSYFLRSGGRQYAKTVGKTFDIEVYGFALNKDNKQLTDIINIALDKLKKNGVYDKIYDKWFSE